VLQEIVRPLKGKAGPGRQRLPPQLLLTRPPVGENTATPPVGENTAAPPVAAPAAPARTASQAKLGNNNFQEVPTLNHNDNFSTTVVHLEMLANLFHNVVCGACHGPVSLRQDNIASRGFSVCLRITCDICGIVSSTYTSRTNDNNAPEVNKAMVASTLSVGLGHTTMSKICEVLGMASLTLKTHQKLVNEIHSSSTLTLMNGLNHARDIVKQVHQPDEEGFFNIPVSFDGTWHKRGHTSNHGAAAVICAVTGLVIDAHVMSLHCQVRFVITNIPIVCENWKVSFLFTCR